MTNKLLYPFQNLINYSLVNYFIHFKIVSTSPHISKKCLLHLLSSVCRQVQLSKWRGGSQTDFPSMGGKSVLISVWLWEIKNKVCRNVLQARKEQEFVRAAPLLEEAVGILFWDFLYSGKWRGSQFGWDFVASSNSWDFTIHSTLCTDSPNSVFNS